jgi:hypothetical protein
MNPYGTFMGTEIAIEISTTGDAEAVTSVLAASYPDLMASAYDDAVLQQALPAMTRVNPKLLGSGTYYVARYHDGLVIGCGDGRPNGRELPRLTRASVTSVISQFTHDGSAEGSVAGSPRLVKRKRERTASQLSRCLPA